MDTETSFDTWTNFYIYLGIIKINILINADDSENLMKNVVSIVFLWSDLDFLQRFQKAIKMNTDQKGCAAKTPKFKNGNNTVKCYPENWNVYDITSLIS